MFCNFKKKNQISISTNKLKIFKKFKQKQLKIRSMVFNSCDSWRKRNHVSKFFFKSYMTWSFNSNFFMCLLENNFNNKLNKKQISNLKPIVSLTMRNIKLYEKKFFILLFYKNFYLFFPLILLTKADDSENLFLNKNNSSFELFNTPMYWLNFNLYNLVKRWFSSIKKVVYNFIFIKLKYKGKNYRWHRKKKGLVLRFGHSHLIYSRKPISVFLKKKGRMKILFFGTNFELIRFFLKNLIRWKPSNVYTARGLRFSRQRLLKKAGKVSAYR